MLSRCSIIRLIFVMNQSFGMTSKRQSLISYHVRDNFFSIWTTCVVQHERGKNWKSLHVLYYGIYQTETKSSALRARKTSIQATTESLFKPCCMLLQYGIMQQTHAQIQVIQNKVLRTFVNAPIRRDLKVATIKEMLSDRNSKTWRCDNQVMRSAAQLSYPRTRTQNSTKSTRNPKPNHKTHKQNPCTKLHWELHLRQQKFYPRQKYTMSLFDFLWKTTEIIPLLKFNKPFLQTCILAELH